MRESLATGVDSGQTRTKRWCDQFIILLKLLYLFFNYFGPVYRIWKIITIAKCHLVPEKKS